MSPMPSQEERAAEVARAAWPKSQTTPEPQDAAVTTAADRWLQAHHATYVPGLPEPKVGYPAPLPATGGRTATMDMSEAMKIAVDAERDIARVLQTLRGNAESLAELAGAAYEYGRHPKPSEPAGRVRAQVLKALEEIEQAKSAAHGIREYLKAAAKYAEESDAQRAAARARLKV